MLSSQNIMQLIRSLIWLLAGVGIFIVGLERMADHLVNIGYSIVNPTGSQKNDI